VAALRTLLSVLWLVGCSAQALASESSLPKVRALTAFVRVTPQDSARVVTDALVVLREAQREFADRGYETQTLRIVTQPLGELVRGLDEAQALRFLTQLDALAARENFIANIGPAMLQESDDARSVLLLERALATLSHLNSSTIIAAEDGVHPRVIHETAALARYLAAHSPDGQGNFNFTASAMLGPYAPFYPAAYHTGAGLQLAIGLESANIVQEVLAQHRGDPAGAGGELTRELTVHAKVAETIGNRIAAAHGWTFAGVDPTPAPLGKVSIGAAMEDFSGGHFGSSGTLTTAFMITGAVKAVAVKQTGFAGLMLPVMEDERLAARWAEGRFDTDALLAYSAVCGTGLDTVPLPGDISAAQLERIYTDVATLAWKWHKPLTARLLPVQGLKAGDHTAFHSPYLFNTVVHAIP